MPQTLLLTGASRGIGLATVERFHAAGWRIITCSRSPVSEDLSHFGGGHEHVHADLSDPRSTQGAVIEIGKHLRGRLDAIVNNAGESPKAADGGKLALVDTDLETWARVFHLNFLAPLTLASSFLNELANAGGSIVNVTSIAGQKVHPFAGAAYATSKAALAALTREMANEFGPYGIRVNAVSPGEIETGILSPGTGDLVHGLPLRRLGQPGEVANTIYFLCSYEASYISGARIDVNGGQLA